MHPKYPTSSGAGLSLAQLRRNMGPSQSPRHSMGRLVYCCDVLALKGGMAISACPPPTTTTVKQAVQPTVGSLMDLIFTNQPPLGVQ